DRKAAAEGLAQSDDVGLNAGMADPPAATCAAQAGDHFVGDEQGSVIMGNFSDGGQEAVRRDDVAGGTLHRFSDDRSDGCSRIQLFFQQFRASQATTRKSRTQRTTVTIRI